MLCIGTAGNGNVNIHSRSCLMECLFHCVLLTAAVFSRQTGGQMQVGIERRIELRSAKNNSDSFVDTGGERNDVSRSNEVTPRRARLLLRRLTDAVFVCKAVFTADELN